MSSKVTDLERAEIARIAAGEDSTYVDDGKGYDYPQPLSAAEQAAVDAVLARAAKGR